MNGLSQFMAEFFETYLMPIMTFIGGGGAVYFIKWRSIKKQAEAEAMKAVQDVYQETIADLRNDKEEMKKEMSELREVVKQNTKDINILKSYKCTVLDCKLRKREII